MVKLREEYLRTKSRDLVDRLRIDRFMPIVGASLTYDLILDGGEKGLATAWAKNLDLPHDPGDPVCRIARYHSYRLGNDLQVKEDYLRFLKDSLLLQAQAAGLQRDILEEVTYRVNELPFTELARELGYPNVAEPRRDPLLLLANLPLGFYVTTSYHGFLEHALRWSGKTPRTAVSCWNEATANLVRPEHRIGPDHDLSVRAPVVFHLFGYEEIPESLVLSEDDILSFLESVAEDPWKDPEARAIPDSVLVHWGSSGLLYLGLQPLSIELKTLWQATGSLDGRRLYESLFQCADVFSQPELREYAERYLMDHGIDMVMWETASDLLNRLQR